MYVLYGVHVRSIQYITTYIYEYNTEYITFYIIIILLLYRITHVLIHYQINLYMYNYASSLMYGVPSQLLTSSSQ